MRGNLFIKQNIVKHWGLPTKTYLLGSIPHQLRSDLQPKQSLWHDCNFQQTLPERHFLCHARGTVPRWDATSQCDFSSEASRIFILSLFFPAFLSFFSFSFLFFFFFLSFLPWWLVDCIVRYSKSSEPQKQQKNAKKKTLKTKSNNIKQDTKKVTF